MASSAPSWHSTAITQVFERLKSGQAGLTSQEAEIRLRQHGANVIERGARRPWFHILIHQIADPLVYVLLVAALLTITIGKVADGMVVLAVVVLNTVIGFV